MVYLNPEALAQMHDDLERRYDDALADTRSARPPAKAGVQ